MRFLQIFAFKSNKKIKTASKEFLEALGFDVIAFYEKYRTIYELKDVHIMLDELPYGNFVEIEGKRKHSAICG